MKIAIVYTLDFSVYRLRRKLLLTLREMGHQVVVLCPRGAYSDRIETELGARVISIPFSRFGGPVADLFAFVRLWIVLRRGDFDLVHNFTIKPNVVGAIAARLANVETVVALVAGLGYAFNDGTTWNRRLLRRVALLAYKIGFRFTDRVWFQNPDDLALFTAAGVIKDGQGVLIRGSGVDLDQFSMRRFSKKNLKRLRQDLGIPDNVRIVVMSARPLESKGVREYMEAARRLREHGVDVACLLMGLSAAGSPEAIPESQLESGPDGFRWLGFRSDADEILALADIVVHPSYYREGIPRSLLEALALEKPIITTDHPGCRETVDEGVNGFLVPPKDSLALSNAIRTLLSDADLRHSFGEAARRKAEEEFSESGVVSKVLEQLYGLPVSDRTDRIREN